MAGGKDATATTSLPSELASEGEGRGGAGAASGVATSRALGSPFLLLMMESDVATRAPSLTLPLASLGRELLLPPGLSP